MSFEDDMQRFAGDIFHYDPLIAGLVGAEIEDIDEIRMLQVDAVRNATQLDAAVAAEQFQRDLFAAIGDGKIDFAEAAFADAALDGVTIERSLTGTVSELH